tara:strand:- start:1099 stop:2232 length:1134 start_codon:yes stop_codon:yes gene_type:complete
MKKIAIVGCGISGLYFASQLQSNKLFDYTIYERKKQLNLNDGYGIQLSVNSIKLLNEIGFKNILAREISFPKKVNFFDARTCKKICDIDISKFNDGNVRYTTLKRSVLIKFLLKNIPEDKIKNNFEINNIEYNNKIKLFLSNNSVQEFDYLVISDGVFSKTKSVVLKKDTNPKFFNSVALRGNIKNMQNNDILIYLGSNFHFVIYPLNQNNEYNFVSIIRKKLNKNEILEDNIFNSSEFTKSLMHEICKKTSFEIQNKLENIKSFPIYVSKKFENYDKKNVFFLGDALFTFPPSFAQGASQSIESAKELYEEINNNTDNYNKNRYIKIKKINIRSKINYFVFHLSNSLAIFLRNIVMKYLSKNNKFLESYLGKIYKN